MKTNNLPVLVLGSSITAVGVIRSLGRAGVTSYSICDSDGFLSASRWYRPAPKVSSHVPLPEELADYLTRLSIRRAVLIPCSDDWVSAVAELPEDLKKRFPASVCSPQTMETLTDKWRFATMLESLGVPRPKTILLRSFSQMCALADSSFTGRFLKPLNSQVFSQRTGVKGFMLESKEQGLSIMEGLERNGAGGFPILLQEYIPGPATNFYLVDGFIDRKQQLRALFARQRLRMYPPVFGNSAFSETIPLERVRSPIETLETIWAAVGYRGIFDAEFKYDDRDGQFKILEINARPWWFIEFAVRCGVDLCRMSYQDALELPVESTDRFIVGRRCSYFMMDFAGFWETDRSLGGFWRWLRSLKGAEDILYCWDDPRPAISSAFASLRRRLGHALKRRPPAVGRHYRLHPSEPGATQPCPKPESSRSR